MTVSSAAQRSSIQTEFVNPPLFRCHNLLPLNVIHAILISNFQQAVQHVKCFLFSKLQQKGDMIFRSEAVILVEQGLHVRPGLMFEGDFCVVISPERKVKRGVRYEAGIGEHMSVWIRVTVVTCDS